MAPSKSLHRRTGSKDLDWLFMGSEGSVLNDGSHRVLEDTW